MKSTPFFFIKKGNRKINFLKEIEGKKIGVLLESSYEQKIINAKGAAFKNEIASVPYDNLNARKLLTGEIDAWYDSIIGGNAFIKNEKLDRNQFEYGNVIDSTGFVTEFSPVSLPLKKS
ncbi:MAG: ABC transporter substrate-binding protein, partial [Silvanigrellaceae bacterium]|nr:ABC transporter substrate-binding protein [Silvanigrellaceae bacterium]